MGPEIQIGLRIPSLRMRACSVVRFIPRMFAAPRAPAMRHSVCRSARKMCCRSMSSKVEIEAVANEAGVACSATGAPCALRSSDSGTRKSLAGDNKTARSIKFYSSRIFPGHA